MLKDENYYAPQGWMRNYLELTGDELTIFAIIWNFCQAGFVTETPITYFMEWTGSSKRTTIRVIESLEEKALINVSRKVGCRNVYSCNIKTVENAKCYWSKNHDSIKLLINI